MPVSLSGRNFLKLLDYTPDDVLALEVAVRHTGHLHFSELLGEADLQISARSLFNPLLTKRHLALLALLRPSLPAQSISVPVDPATL